MSISPWKRFWLLLQPDRKEIRNIYLFAIFSGLIYLSVPLGIQAITNLIQMGKINASWILLVSIVIASVGFSGLLNIQQLKIIEFIQQRIFARAAFELSYRIPRIKEEELKDKYAPELMNRFFDTVSVQKGISKIIVDFSGAIVQIIFGMIVLAFYHPFYIIFSLVLIFSVFIFIRLSFARGLNSSLDESKYKYRMAHWLEEVARNKKAFKLLGNPEIILNRTNSEVNSYLDARESHFKTLMIQFRLMVIFKILLIAGLLIIGGILVMEQLMNIGQFVAAEIIILLIMSSVEKIILSFETVYDVLTSLEKIGQITDLELEKDSGYSIQKTTKPLQLSLQEFLPSKHFIQPINFEINSGQCCLIKTENETLIRQFIDVLAGDDAGISGNYVINHFPFTNLNLESLRTNIGFVLDSDTLFNGTMMENLTLGKNNIESKKMIELLEILGINQVIYNLKQGFDTKINYHELMFSEKIVNRIVLARNILHEPMILIIQNPSEFCDTQMFEGLMKYIKNYHPEMIKIIFEENEKYNLTNTQVYHLSDNGLTLKH